MYISILLMRLCLPSYSDLLDVTLTYMEIPSFLLDDYGSSESNGETRRDTHDDSLVC